MALMVQPEGHSNLGSALSGNQHLAHEHLLRPRIGSLFEMSREYRHIYRNVRKPQFDALSPFSLGRFPVDAR
jgi:hypothetical protein